MISESYSPEEFSQLIVSAASYTTKIQAFSNKISDAPMQDQLQCLTQAHKVLTDQSIPIIKKLFVIRFIKDTMLLASLSFYECVLVKIFPWLTALAESLKTRNLQSKYAEVGKFLRGNSNLATAEMSVCKNFINLIEDVIKWMGTYIRDHPYTSIKYRSAFKMLLETLPIIQANKVSELNFFKPEDPYRYQSYYLQKESGEAEGQKIGQFVGKALRWIEKGQSSDDLQRLVETGDGNAITFLVQEFDAYLQQIEPSQASKRVKTVEVIDDLMNVRDIQFCNKVKLDLTPKLVSLIQMLHHHQIQDKGGSSASKLTSMLTTWQQICEQLGLSVGCFEAALNVLKADGIIASSTSANNKYISPLKLTTEINKQKLSSLQLSESETILKITMCKYIPFYESKVPDGKPQWTGQKIMKMDNSQENSLSSNKSSAKKINQLQTYSKIPQNNLKNNVSEVKEIHFQHSNLSDQFVQHHPKPQSTTPKQLLISFKKDEGSPDVVFSDSFNSNQKYSPQKLSPIKYTGLDNKYIDIIEQPSMSMANSQKSRPIEQKPSKQILNSSCQKEISDNIQLHQQSNKKTSKISEVSDYYPEDIKYSANFNKEPSSSKQKSIINDYLLPENNSEAESAKRSKPSIKNKTEKSSSIRNSRGSALIRNNSKERVVVSPRSRISHSRSIKLIQFNEAEGNNEQGYQIMSPNNVVRPAVEAIKVEKTLKKPKFGFKCEEQPIETDEIEPVQGSNQQLAFSLSKTESISVDPSIESRSLQEVPQNFGELLTLKRNPVKVNNFDYKIKQLQMKISRMKEKKGKIEEKVVTKDKQIMKIKQEMPTPLKDLQEENQRLLKALKKPKQTMTKKGAISMPSHDFKGQLLHLSVVPMNEQLKKQILYSKCRLLQTEELEVGMQIKNKEITFYLTIKKAADEVSVKVEMNSLKLSQPLDAKIYNVLEGKQVKFKSKIVDYTLFDNSFELGKLKVDLKYSTKTSKSYKMSIPYSLYNELTFHSPRHIDSYAKSTDWHFCCSPLLSDPQYLSDFLPNSKYVSGRYETRIQLNGQYFNYLVVIEGDKFKIEFQQQSEECQVGILKCLLSLFEKCQIRQE